MNTIYVVEGRAPAPPAAGLSVPEVTRRYYAAEALARAAVSDLVLDCEMRTPITVRPVEVHGAEDARPGAEHDRLPAPALDSLARLPWSTTKRGRVNDATGSPVLQVDGMANASDDERLAALLVQVVNEVSW